MSRYTAWGVLEFSYFTAIIIERSADWMQSSFRMESLPHAYILKKRVCGIGFMIMDPVISSNMISYQGEISEQKWS